MEKKYVLPVEGELIEVSEAVYKAYYKEKNHEDYVTKRNEHREYSLDGMEDERDYFEFNNSLVALSPEDIYIKKVEREAMKRAILSLREDERNLIQLIFYQEFKVRAIADLYNTNHTAIIRKRNRILKKLAENIKIQENRVPKANLIT